MTFCANFSRLSNSAACVNLILKFFQKLQLAIYSTSAENNFRSRGANNLYQNIVTAQKQPRSTQLPINFNCSGLGLEPDGLWLESAIKRLDCASDSLTPYTKCGAKLTSPTHQEYRASHLRASPSASCCDFLRVSVRLRAAQPLPCENLTIPVGILLAPLSNLVPHPCKSLFIHGLVEAWASGMIRGIVLSRFDEM